MCHGMCHSNEEGQVLLAQRYCLTDQDITCERMRVAGICKLKLYCCVLCLELPFCIKSSH
jgi:hypothetical protein